jgi:hemin uptake protein HemP
MKILSPPSSAVARAAPAMPKIAAGALNQRRHIRSVELFSGQREVLIEHAGEIYSLRQTSKGKLILTK